jgi:hypothetical protein
VPTDSRVQTEGCGLTDSAAGTPLFTLTVPSWVMPGARREPALHCGH